MLWECQSQKYGCFVTLKKTTEAKPEQIFAVGLCFNSDDKNSDVSSVLHVQNRAKQSIGGSNVSHPYNSPISIMDEGLPCKHEQLTGSFFSEEYVLLSKIIHIFLDTQSPGHKSTGTDRVLFKSFPHSFQGIDLPFLESCLSTSLMDLQRKQAKRTTRTFQIYQTIPFRAWLFISIIHLAFLSSTNLLWGDREHHWPQRWSHRYPDRCTDTRPGSGAPGVEAEV